MKKNLTLSMLTIILMMTVFIFISPNFVNATTQITTDGVSIFTTVEPETQSKILQVDSKTNMVTEVNMDEVVQRISKTKSTNGNVPDFTSSYTPVNLLNNNETKTPGLRASSLIRIANTTNTPYIKVCRISWNGGSGSGYLVGPNLVLTAAHCFLDVNGNVLPEWTCNPAYDYGVYNNLTSGWQEGFYGSNWVSTRSASEDWCIVVLDWNMGNEVGWFGCQSYGTNAEMNNIFVHSIGYPETENCQYQYYAPGNILTTYNGYFDMSATPRPGMSGGPIMRWSDDVAIGINHGYYDDSVQNGVGCRIHQEIINIILDHR